MSNFFPIHHNFFVQCKDYCVQDNLTFDLAQTVYNIVHFDNSYPLEYTHYETKYCNLRVHSSFSLLYIHIYKMTVTVCTQTHSLQHILVHDAK